MVNEIDILEDERKELENIFEEVKGMKEGRSMMLRELWRREKFDFIIFIDFSKVLCVNLL